MEVALRVIPITGHYKMPGTLSPVYYSGYDSLKIRKIMPINVTKSLSLLFLYLSV
jgi:hypothetical protein